MQMEWIKDRKPTLVALVDATLADVPLSSEEAEEARRDLGVDPSRLSARIRTRLDEVR